METEHARLLEQGWRLGLDGCYRKSEPEQGEAEAGYSEIMTLPAFLVRRTLPVRHFPGWRQYGEHQQHRAVHRNVEQQYPLADLDCREHDRYCPALVRAF